LDRSIHARLTFEISGRFCSPEAIRDADDSRISPSPWSLLMKPAVFVVLGILCAVASRAASAEDSEPAVEVAVLTAENWERFVPHGKEVDAIAGDLVIRNQFMTAVIAQPLASRHANMVVREVGGCLIDLADRQNQSDQLACFYPGGRSIKFRNCSVQMEKGAAVPLSPRLEMHGTSARILVTATGDERLPTLEVSYSLGEHDRFMTVTSTYRNSSTMPLVISLLDEIQADGAQEEMAKTSDGVCDLYWIEDRFWRAAYGIQGIELALQCTTDGSTAAIAFIDDAGTNRRTLGPGESLSVSRRITCGSTLAHVRAAFADQQKSPFKVVKLRLQDGLRRGIDHARIRVRQKDLTIASGRANGDGEISLPLLPGDYKVELLSESQPRSQSVLHVGEAANQSLTAVFNDEFPGTIYVAIVDERQQGMPCKVQFIGRDSTPSPYFGPRTAAFGVRNVRYTPDGSFVEDLPTGTYDVIVSRGPEYEILTKTVTVEKGKKAEVRGTLKRSMNTPGWVSADFHSHSSPSGDTTASQLGRVLNLVCEQIEFAPCTEHNRISSFRPHIDRLGIPEWISSVPGIELTGAQSIGRHSIFPLREQSHLQDGGGPLPNKDIAIQLQRAIAWDEGSEKLVQQNQPDIGWLFYDRDGDGKADAGHPEAVSLLDAMEIDPIEDILKLSSLEGLSDENAKANRVFHWLQLMNQGYRITAVANSAAHDNFHGSGGQRNWVRCPTDDPANIDPLDIVHAVKKGQIIVSNGPFLSVTARAGEAQAGAGEDLIAPDGKITLEISVQTPGWFDVDTVLILVNGRLHREHLFTRSQHARLFGAAPIRFQQKIPLQLREDSHLVVATGALGSTLGPSMGPAASERHPAAFANPIFVDVDSPGMRPNKDTLERPLPVKGK
jgi:hypothetical protein